MLDLPEPIAVVCHDAGSANIIIATMRADLGGSAAAGCYLPVMHGPANNIWKSSSIVPATLFTLTEALSGARSLISGTGWASSLEHDARQLARTLQIPSVALVDHWVNYAARFERQGTVVLPDQIVVTDSDAETLAAQTFPGLPLRRISNAYLQEQLASINPVTPQAQGHILYVLEPLRYTWPGATQAGEFEALDYLVANLDKLGEIRNWSIRLRPHPSDTKGKYDDWIARQHGLDIDMDRSSSLAESINSAEWVAGCESAALTVALAAGRKTLSTLPPQAPACRLPQQGLLHLRHLAALR